MIVVIVVGGGRSQDHGGISGREGIAASTGQRGGVMMMMKKMAPGVSVELAGRWRVRSGSLRGRLSTLRTEEQLVAVVAILGDLCHAPLELFERFEIQRR